LSGVYLLRYGICIFRGRKNKKVISGGFVTPNEEEP
jgi:hypothetical protein